MKIYLLAAVLVSSGSFAADTSKNPDRLASVGIDFTQSRAAFTGPAGELYDPKDNSINFASGHTTLQASQLTLDFRAPVSNLVTVDIHGGPSTLKSFGDIESGYSVGGGVRVYLPFLE